MEVYGMVQCSADLMHLRRTCTRVVVDGRHSEGNIRQLHRGIHYVVIGVVDYAENMYLAAWITNRWSDLAHRGCDA